MIRQVAVAYATLLLIAVTPLMADGIKPPSPIVRASGRAVVYNDDLSGARDRAVRAGLLRALEQYAGMRIEASTIIKRGDLIDRQLKSSTKGFVKSHKILSEKRDGQEIVVNLEVVVSPAPVAESFRQAISSTSTLLLIDESNLGSPVEGQILPVVLADPFFTSKVIVAKDADVARARTRVTKAFYRNPDVASVRELGLSQTCGLVIVAWADTRKLDSSNDSIGYQVDPSVLRPVVAAEGNVVIFSAEDGRVIASRRFDDVRGSDSTDSRRAGVSALHRVAEMMRDVVVAKVTEFIKESGHKLTVTVVSASPGARAATILELLKDTRWVTSAEVVSQDARSAVIEATCDEKPMYVVEELRRQRGVKIVKYDLSRAFVHVQ